MSDRITTTGTLLGMLGLFVGGPFKCLQCRIRGHHDPLMKHDGTAICRTCYVELPNVLRPVAT